MRWNPLANLPRWPDTVRQPIGNPLQSDRLPDTSGVELEYPARGQSLEASRACARRRLAWYAFASFFVGASGLLLQGRLLGLLLTAGYATAAFLLIVQNDPFFRRTSWAWSLFGGPVLFIALITFREPAPYLLVCLLAALRIPDLFASHYFHLKTTAPLPRTRAQALRILWSRRVRSLTTAAKGLELYAVTALAVFAVIVLVYAWEAGNRAALMGTKDRYLDVLIWFYIDLHGGPLAAGLLVLFAAPWVAEQAIAFLFARKPVPLRTMVRAFREALTDWLAYNRHDSTAVGVFQSPSGSYRGRGRLTLATIVAFACLMVEFSNKGRVIWERIGPLEAIGAFSEPKPVGRFPAASIRLVSYQPQDPPLEPYQERMLQRMKPEERADYLERLRARTPRVEEPKASAPEAAKDEGPPSDWQRFQRRLFVNLPTGLELAAVPLFFALIPPLYFLACCFATSARVAGLWSQEFKTESGSRLLNTESWDDLVTRIQASGDRIERESLLLGVNAHDDSPVIVPRSVFQEHAHLLGDSGSGKTSLGIASLLTQFIRFGDCSVVVIDLKGDDVALMEGARIEAERAGIRFRWFTNELERPTYVFNPMTQSHLSRLSLYQRTDILTSSLGLQYGTDYGRGFFSDANSEMLYHALKARPEGIPSFTELAAVLREKAPFRNVPEDLRAAGSHLNAIINRLADTKALNATVRDGAPASAIAQGIDMPDVFRRPQVLYFHLASAIGMASTAEIARLALYSLLTAAKTAQGERTQVYLVVDEFQRIVSNNLELFLQQARSLNIGVILANQTLGDLKTADTDLIPTVRANTRFRQIFAASDVAEQDEIIKTSGETAVFSRAWSQYLGNVMGASGTFSLTETLTPRLRVNDVLLATDHPQQSIVQVRRGQGYAQFGGFPFVMTSAFHITREEYARRKRAPWPHKDGETICPTLAPLSEAAMPPSKPEPQAPEVLVGPTEVIGPKPATEGRPAEASPDEPPQESAPLEAETPPAEPMTAAEHDPFAALTRYQEERKRSRTRKKKGDSP